MSTKPVLMPTSVAAAAMPKLAIQGDLKTAACMALADLAALVLVFAATLLNRHFLWPVAKWNASLELLPCLAIIQVTFWAQGLYPGVLRHPAEEMRRIYSSITLVVLAIASTTFLWRTAQFYMTLSLAWIIAPPFVLLARYLVRRWMAEKPWWGVPAVVLGSGPTAQKVIRSLSDGTLGVKIVGVVTSERMLAWSNDAAESSDYLWSQWFQRKTMAAQYAIIAMPERLAVELRLAIQYYCKGFSHVILIPDIPNLCTLGLSALEIGGSFGVEMPQRLFHRGAAATKRIMDLAFGTIALLLASVPALLVALAIKATSKGPVFYRQTRVGRNGEAIRALKFRTMVADAESVLTDYLAANPEARLEWQRDHKLKNDPRVTPVGRWLRRFSLDELPQLYNVVRGEMSLVGPRPIVQSEIERYGRGYELYTRVRPGITGLWQVSGRNNTTYDERVAFDEYYVRNWSGWLDAYLMVCTIKAVVTAHGAY